MTLVSAGKWWDRLTDWQLGGLLLAVTRVALLVAGFVGIALTGEDVRRLHLAPDQPWLQLWAQWDSEHYINIALKGYTYAPFVTAPFSPLYPALIATVLALIGRSADIGAATFVGFVISNVALAVALTYVFALVARDMGVSTARRAVIYVLIFPTTLFLSSVYAEALFLATGVASLYHARKGEWYRAGFAGFLAALTRPYGFLFAVPIAIELWRQRAPVLALPSALLPPLGMASYLTYLWAQYGDPLFFFKASAAWGRSFHSPLDTFLNYLRGPLVLYDWPYSWLDLISMIAMVVLLVVGWRLVPLSYWAYVAVGLLFDVSSGLAWFSASRHALTLFPIIVILAALGQRYRRFAWVWAVLSAFLALAFMTRFGAGHWLA